jgi:hypothetical protein
LRCENRPKLKDHLFYFEAAIKGNGAQVWLLRLPSFYFPDALSGYSAEESICSGSLDMLLQAKIPYYFRRTRGIGDVPQVRGEFSESAYAEMNGARFA